MFTFLLTPKLCSWKSRALTFYHNKEGEAETESIDFLALGAKPYKQIISLLLRKGLQRIMAMADIIQQDTFHALSLSSQVLTCPCQVLAYPLLMALDT